MRRTETTQAARPAPRPAQIAAQGAAPPQELQQVTTAPAAASLPGPTPASTPTLAPESASPTATLAPEHNVSFLPWLLAAVALGAGGAFMFWRRSSRPAYAGGPQIDLFTTPEPEPVRAPSPPPAPRPAPVPSPRATTPPPAPAPAPAPVGIVSTALRAWIEVAMQPTRCIVTDEAVTFEFELDLFNSGSAPARDIHVAAVVINAGASQDQHIEGFFAQPAGPGERIPIIEPLKRVTFTTQIATGRDHIQVLEMGGRHVFVPLLAFNATYRQGSKEGQTSASYLVGRNSDGKKLAPFRLDLGPRVFRGLGARPLPQGVRK